LLTPAPALCRAHLDAVLLELRHGGEATKDVHDARRSQAPCCICLSLVINDDLKVGLAVLVGIRECCEPLVCSGLFAVGHSYEMDIWMRWGHVSQIEKGLLRDCNESIWCTS
jgi:hypothetical protein